MLVAPAPVKPAGGKKKMEVDVGDRESPTPPAPPAPVSGGGEKMKAKIRKGGKKKGGGEKGSTDEPPGMVFAPRKIALVVLRRR